MIWMKHFLISVTAQWWKKWITQISLPFAAKVYLVSLFLKTMAQQIMYKQKYQQFIDKMEGKNIFLHIEKSEHAIQKTLSCSILLW